MTSSDAFLLLGAKPITMVNRPGVSSFSHRGGGEGGNDDLFDNDPSLEQIERARCQFEAMMGPVTNLLQPQQGEGIITTTNQRRGLLEIEMLESLAYSDEPVDALMGMWVNERGPTPAQDLERMQEYCSPALVQEERMLRDMSHATHFEWMEPIIRLATLLFYRGLRGESYDLCQYVLEHKPWHFEAAHLKLLHCLTSSHPALPSRWSVARSIVLPPLNPRTNNKSRKQWVRRMVAEAKASMVRGEMHQRHFEPEQGGGYFD